MKNKKSTTENTKRPPIVVVMGHIDHGKSTLLDYIKKTNEVEKEIGGITQRLSAYEVSHKTQEGSLENITFLDTPGHEAFQKMRLRGADVADVAILIVSAEDGVKPQTLEALSSIKQANIPFVVAINKIDKPTANIARTQASLIENEIYIEGMGGDIPWVGISAKAGTGVADLLDLVILTADLIDLKGNASSPAVGQILESNADAKRGNTATLLIKNGTLKAGTFVVSGSSFSPVRIMENYRGKIIKEASFSSPVRLIGFNKTPTIGLEFYTVGSKKEAEQAILNAEKSPLPEPRQTKLPTVPILIKVGSAGAIDAIKHEVEKLVSDRIYIRVIDSGVGDITASDVQNVSATKDSIIVGFNVKTERQAVDLAERVGVEIKTFDIIYDLSDWLKIALKERTPKKEEIVYTGKIKILKHFSTQKNTHVIGARIEEGFLELGQKVKITRREVEIGKGVIKNLQQQKSDVQKITEGEFGMQLETKADTVPGDVLESYKIIIS